MDTCKHGETSCVCALCDIEAIRAVERLKFRVWSERDDIEFVNDLYWFEEHGVQDGRGEGHHVNYKIMQFSGLQDSLGVDIYEGDKVYLSGYGIYEVVFPFTELYNAIFIGEIMGCIYER